MQACKDARVIRAFYCFSPGCRSCGIPIVVSRSAPTNRGVSLAREMGITLVGFARGIRMNIYSGEGRLRI